MVDFYKENEENEAKKTTHTPPRSHRISWLKSQVLKPTFLEFKMMVESGLEFFYFEISLAPPEIPANLPGQFSLSVQIFFALGSSNSERAKA